MGKSKAYDDWIVRLVDNIDDVTFVERAGDAVNASAIVCRLATTPLILPDNLTGTCAKCFRMVQFRPHNPKGVPMICDECVPREIKRRERKGDKISYMITARTAADVMQVIRKRGVQ